MFFFIILSGLYYYYYYYYYYSQQSTNTWYCLYEIVKKDKTNRYFGVNTPSASQPILLRLYLQRLRHQKMLVVYSEQGR